MKSGIEKVKVQRKTEGVFLNGTLRTPFILTLMVICLLFILNGCGKGEGVHRHIERLGSTNEALRDGAIDELGRRGEDVAPLLQEAFLEAPSDEEGVRIVQGAGQLLRDIATLENMQVAAERLSPEEEPNPKIRLEAIRIVSRTAEVHRRIATQHLEKALEDPDLDCQKAAARGLKNMHFAEAADILEERFSFPLDTASLLCAKNLYDMDRRPEAAEALLDALADEDDELREVAIEAIVDLGTDLGAGEDLLTALVDRHSEYPEQEGINSALEQIRDVLLERIEGVQPPRRTRLTMEKLGLIADEKVLNRLGEVIQSRDESTYKRVAAADAMGRAMTSEKRPAGRDAGLRGEGKDLLFNVMEEDGVDHRIKIAAAISLARMQEKEGVSFLLSQLEQLDAEADPDADREELITLRLSAQEAMEASGEFVIPALLEALENPQIGRTTQWAAAYTLAQLKEENAKPFFIDFIGEQRKVAELSDEAPEDEEIEMETADGTVKVTVNRYSLLREAFGDDRLIPRYSPAVRIAAADGLGRLGGKEAADALKNALNIHENLIEEMEEFVRARQYTAILPGDVLDDERRREVREDLRDISEEILREHRRVTFFLRKAIDETDIASQQTP